jgi:GT2 family glycosyltransferase
MIDGDLPPMTSVVVPTHNRADKLRVCLEGVLTQDYPRERYEVIIADDGSSDATQELVGRFAGRAGHPRVRLVRGPHRGPSAARNAGIAAAAGDPLVIIDDDTDVPPTWLRALVDGIGRHPEAQAFGGPIRLRLEGPAPHTCGREQLATALDLGPAVVTTSHVLGANMALRRSALERAGGFDERIVIGSEEIEWMGRLQAAGGRIVYIPEAWLWHRRTGRDLRLGRMLRERFVRGVHTHRFMVLAQCSVGVRWALRPIPGALAHALCRRCAGGLILAAGWAGYAYGLARYGRAFRAQIARPPG